MTTLPTPTPDPRVVEHATVALIPGDGIGPEIANAVVQILEAAGAPIVWERHEAGKGSLAVAPNGLPVETLAAISRHGLALKGPTETPAGSGHKSVNVTIRKSLDLYANVRPIRSLPGTGSRFADIDLVIVRENIEDTYGGIEHYQTADVVQCLKVITRPGSLAAIRYAFELARAWGRKQVTCIHKANIHKLSDGLFLSCFQEVAASNPDIISNDLLVDNACMQLVTDPTRFDVMVMPNLYGDILSDLAAGLVGGLGVAPSGNIGRDTAVFEAVHGSAPDIAGMGIANPTALLLSSVQMLRYMGQNEHAARVEMALLSTLADGIRTRDLGGTASTQTFTDAVIARLPPSGLKTTVVVDRRITPATVGERKAASPLEFIGLDVFVEHQSLPPLPERVGPFRLILISNRGTKVWPGSVPDILLVDWYRARYVAEGPSTDADISNLLAAVALVAPWMHIEKLRAMAGKPLYSKAQGE